MTFSFHLSGKVDLNTHSRKDGWMAITRVMILSTFFLSSSVTDGQPRKITWGMNTNFENPQNWDGFSGVDCSKNIYSFPMSMDMTVISFPGNNSVLSTRQIILPRNGRLVFQPGTTTLFNSPLDTCQGVELKFRRTTRADWFDPDNWIESDSLLSVRAIPQVERVPCPYDSAQFPSKTTFNLFISSHVVLHKFFLGDEELSYTDLATFISFGLGKIQFLKDPETKFELSNVEWQDSDQFICTNYQPEIKQKICSLADCGGSDGDDCPNPLRPHGFCCSVCGFHLKIQHDGRLRLSPVRTKLRTRLKSLNLGSAAVGTHVTRNAEKWAHIVFIPWMNKIGDVRKIINEIRSFLHDDPSVVETTVSDSWEGSSGDADALTSSGTPAGIIILIVLLILLTIAGAIFLIFFWNRRGQGPVLTFSAVMSRLQQISMPTIPTLNMNPRRPSFAFARFSNERVSSINIGQMSSGNIERTDKVDTDVEPMDVNVPEETTTSGIGFTNVVYDIIGVNDGATGGGSGGDAELNKSSSLATDMENPEHVYDLVEVHGGSGGAGSGLQLQTSKTIEKEE